MTYAILGALLFGGPHLFSTLLPGMRDGVEKAMGEKAWKGVYSLITLLGVVMFILAYRNMGEGTSADLLYEPWSGGRHAVLLSTLLGLILIGASHGKGYIKTFVRHPMSLGVALWSGGHLLANGERTLVWLFGTFFVVAVADVIFSFARGKKPDHVPHVKSDIRAIVIGIVLYVILAFAFHPYVIGVPVT
jgi:uncharacterized membrane protein